uniref:Uncharacterized protein n=1 Tax=Arundo donax TaxID=35708 RepID=A0A0A9DMU2_ARUDO
MHFLILQYKKLGSSKRNLVSHLDNRYFDTSRAYYMGLFLIHDTIFFSLRLYVNCSSFDSLLSVVKKT